jgi:hypothetical protein
VDVALREVVVVVEVDLEAMEEGPTEHHEAAASGVASVEVVAEAMPHTEVCSHRLQHRMTKIGDTSGGIPQESARLLRWRSVDLYNRQTTYRRTPRHWKLENGLGI